MFVRANRLIERFLAHQIYLMIEYLIYPYISNNVIRSSFMTDFMTIRIQSEFSFRLSKSISFG